MKPYKRTGEIMIPKKEVRSMMKDIETGKVSVITPKLTNSIPCDVCDHIMDLVSIEEGYNCRNENCVLHMETTV